MAAIDRYAAEHGQTRSGLLATAAVAYIGREDDKRLRAIRRGRKPKRAVPNRHE